MIATALDDFERAMKNPAVWALVTLVFTLVAILCGFPAANFVINMVQTVLIVLWLIAGKVSHRENRALLVALLEASTTAREELARIEEEDRERRGAE